jgi:putative ABC transport system permease protein
MVQSCDWMKWFLKTAIRETRRSWSQGVWMLVSMVFGLGVLVSFSAINQGFKDDFYEVAALLSGGDLRVEIEGTPTERLRRLLPQLGEARESYHSLAITDDPASTGGALRLWWVDPSPRPLPDRLGGREWELPQPLEVTLYGTAAQLALLKTGAGGVTSVEGGLQLRVGSLIALEQEPLPLWMQRLYPGEGERVVASTPLGHALSMRMDLPWRQVWVYHLGSGSIRERVARASFVLSYIREESQGVRLIHELPDEGAFYHGFRLVSNTLFLAAFAALMLGTLAYTVTFVDFAKGKVQDAALLRCLGGSRLSTWWVHGVPVLLYAVTAVTMAAVLATLSQWLVAHVTDAVWFEEGEWELQWRPVLLSLGFGGSFLILPGLAAVFPLFGCEPVEVLRSTKVPAQQDGNRWLQVLLIGVTAFLALAFCLVMVEDAGFVVLFLGGLLVGFAVMMAGVIGLRHLVRGFLKEGVGYALAQASANLFRARNHYLLTISSIASGLCLMTLLFTVFKGFDRMGMQHLVGLDGVADERVQAYVVWLQRVFFINQWVGVLLMVAGVLAVLALLTTQRRTRLYEAVVLSTLGAPSDLIRRIMLLESLLVAGIASILGPLAGVILGNLLLALYWDLGWMVPWGPIICMPVLTAGVIAGAGWLNLKSILGQAPLEVLRKRRHFSNW